MVIKCVDSKKGQYLVTLNPQEERDLLRKFKNFTTVERAIGESIAYSPESHLRTHPLIFIN
jgi:hypothetical protein